MYWTAARPRSAVGAGRGVESERVQEGRGSRASDDIEFVQHAGVIIDIKLPGEVVCRGS